MRRLTAPQERYGWIKILLKRPLPRARVQPFGPAIDQHMVMHPHYTGDKPEMNPHGAALTTILELIEKEVKGRISVAAIRCQVVLHGARSCTAHR
jgi:hypothetical protein